MLGNRIITFFTRFFASAATAFILISFLSLPAFPQSSDIEKIILVGDFINQTGDPKWDGVGIGIASSIAVKIGNIKSITVTDEESRRRVMSEQRFGQSGFVDTQTAVDTGKLVGATHIAYGTYTLAGDQLMAFAFLINCTTGAQEGSCEAYANTDATASLINEISLGLVAKLGVTTTQSEFLKIESSSIGNTIDTLALMGEADKIVFDGSVTWEPQNLMYAKEIYELVLKDEPENIHAQKGLAIALRGLDDNVNAIKQLREVVSLDNDDEFAHINLAFALWDIGDLEGAAKEFALVFEVDPNDSFLRCCCGDVLFELENYTEAIAQYLMAIGLDPTYSDAWCNAGRCYFLEGELGRARFCFEQTMSCSEPGEWAYDTAAEYLAKM